MNTIRTYRATHRLLTVWHALPMVVMVGAVPSLFSQEFDPVLMKQSAVTFLGTVLRQGAVAFDAVPRSGQTAIVRVDQVLEKPTVIALNTGDTVTVLLNDPASLPEGSRATFYTEGWIVGRGIALKELGHRPAKPEDAAVGPEQMRQAYRAAQRQMRDEDLRARLARAAIVAHGMVVRVRPAEEPKRIITEHDPEWQEAVVQVRTAIKGVNVGEQIVVRFAGSKDVAFYRSPKFKPGDEPIVVGVKDTLTGLPRAMLEGKPTEAYIVESPSDVLPREELERVQRLAK